MNLSRLDKKYFSAKKNSENGEVSKDTRFFYRVKNGVITATYSGGDILEGQMIGKETNEGKIEFRYQHLNVQNELKTGNCLTSIIISKRGSLILNEEWEWTSGNKGKGQSTVEEIIE